MRVMGTCYVTGHVAGVAAATLVKNGNVDVNIVREELVRQGALI